jgi:hypothetical protein
MSSSPLVLYIGRSLIQTLACLARFPDAIHLASQIRYNLSYIRGALDRSTLDFTLLLSELYTATGRYAEAMQLHEQVLLRLSEGDADGTADGNAHGEVSLATAQKHAELLKYAFKRHGKFDKSTQHYADMFSALDAQFGAHKGWAAARPKVEAWTPGVKEGEALGCWRPPVKFEWGVEGEESVGERKWREELVRRRASGNLWARGSA